MEAVAGLWCASLGFSSDRLREAADRQMRKLPYYHGFGAKSHEPMIELAEMWCSARRCRWGAPSSPIPAPRPTTPR